MELGVCVGDRPVAEVARLGRFAEDHGFEEAEREQALAAVAGTG